VSISCVLLIVGSVALQIVGLGLVARDLWRVQHRELGSPRWWLALRARWRRLLGRPPTVHEVSVGLAGTAEVAGRLRIHRGTGPDATLEARVVALEANVKEMDEYLQTRLVEIDQQLDKVRESADEVRAYVDQLRQEQDQARREELRETLPWQWIGTGLFAIGALLAMWSDLAC
jgi:hypothetical protein